MGDDTQATANWLDLTSFCPQNCLFLWHRSPCAHYALGFCTHGTEMTTRTCSALQSHFPAWWDFQVRAVDVSPSTGYFQMYQSSELTVCFVCPQVNESDADDQDFGDYALDFMAGENKKKFYPNKYDYHYQLRMMLQSHVGWTWCLSPLVRFSYHTGEQPVSGWADTVSGMRHTSPHPPAGVLCWGKSYY